MGILKTKNKAYAEAQKLAKEYDVERNQDGTFSLYKKGDPKKTKILTDRLIDSESGVVRRLSPRARKTTEHFLDMASRYKAPEKEEGEKKGPAKPPAPTPDVTPDVTPEEEVLLTYTDLASLWTKNFIKKTKDIVPETTTVDVSTISSDVKKTPKEGIKKDDTKRSPYQISEPYEDILSESKIYKPGNVSTLKRGLFDIVDFAGAGIPGMIYGEPGTANIDEFQNAQNAGKEYVAIGANLYNVEENLKNYRNFGSNWKPVTDSKYGLFGKQPGGMAGPPRAMFAKGYAKKELYDSRDLPFESLPYMFGFRSLKKATEVPKSVEKTRKFFKSLKLPSLKNMKSKLIPKKK